MILDCFRGNMGAKEQFHTMAPRRNGSGRRQQDDDQDDEPQGLSDDARDEIGQMINAAVSGHFQRKMPTIIQQAIAGPLAEMRALVEGGQGRRSRTPDADDPDLDEPDVDEQPVRGARGQRARSAGADRAPVRRSVDRGGEAESPEAGRKMSHLEKEVAKLKAEREQERQAARAATRDGSLRELLGGAGVDKNRLRGAAAVLRESTRYDDKANEWFFVRKVDGVDEEVDLETGVRDWAGTDEGKSYLAPPQPGGFGAGAGGPRQQPMRSGSGTRPSAGGGAASRGGSSNPTPDAKQARSAAKAQAMQQLTGAINELSGGGTMPLG